MSEILDSIKIRGRFEITIPKEVRDFLKLNPGDLLIFELKKKQILLHKGKIGTISG